MFIVLGTGFGTIKISFKSKNLVKKFNLWMQKIKFQLSSQKFQQSTKSERIFKRKHKMKYLWLRILTLCHSTSTSPFDICLTIRKSPKMIVRSFVNIHEDV
jgi:hypothetical protein